MSAGSHVRSGCREVCLFKEGQFQWLFQVIFMREDEKQNSVRGREEGTAREAVGKQCWWVCIGGKEAKIWDVSPDFTAAALC